MVERIVEGNIFISAQLLLNFFHILKCLEEYYCMAKLIDKG